MISVTMKGYKMASHFNTTRVFLFHPLLFEQRASFLAL